MVRDAGLSAGERIDDARLKELLRAAALHECREKALSFLARREHNEREMTRKLSERGYAAGVVGDTVRALAAEGAIDDRRYASEWIWSRLRRRPEGRSAILAGLLQRGVSEAIAVVALDEAVDDEREDEALAAAARKLARRPGLTRERLARQLTARGFPASKVIELLERPER